MEQKDMGPFSGMDPALNEAISRYGTPPYRQIVSVSVRDVGNYNFDELPDTIDGWIEWLNEVRQEAPEEYRDGLRCVLKYESGYYDSGDSCSLDVWYERPETDAEMQDRVGRGIAYIREQQDQERATYEALKRKFERD